MSTDPPPAPPSAGATDRPTAFVGSIPDVYDEHLAALLFEPYAVELVARLADLTAGSLLEVAAGTGVVTRRLAAALPAAVSIVATDLNQAMLDRGQRVGTARPVTWQQADAAHLPFPDEAFDVVVCQFGAMFFPDRPAAFAEMRRVLRPGGRLLFDVWTGVEDSPLAEIAAGIVAAAFPDDPPSFIQRVPHGYHDPAQLAADVRAGGFGEPAIETVDARSRAATSRAVAVGFCRGTPMYNEIVARNPALLDALVEQVDAAIAARYGTTDIDAPMRARIVTATR